MEVVQTKISRYKVLCKDEQNFVIDLESNTLAYFFPSFSWFMKRKIYVIKDREIIKDLIGKPKMQVSIWLIYPLSHIASNYTTKILSNFDMQVSKGMVFGMLFIFLSLLIGLKIARVSKDKRKFEKMLNLSNIEVLYIKYHLNFSQVRTTELMRYPKRDDTLQIIKGE